MWYARQGVDPKDPVAISRSHIEPYDDERALAWKRGEKFF